MTEDDLPREFDGARPRFVMDELTHNGERHARLTDPVTGLSAHCAIEDQASLPWHFRGIWIAAKLKDAGH